MKRFLYTCKTYLLVASLLVLGSCDLTQEDIVPVTFTDIKIYPDEIYVIQNSTVRLDHLLNDSLKGESSISYTQPKNGVLLPEYDGPGTIGYRPREGYIGKDSLSYTVCSGNNCATEQINLIVDPPLDPNNCRILLRPDSAETTLNTPVTLRVYLNDDICFNEDYGGDEVRAPLFGSFTMYHYAGSYKNTHYLYSPPKNYVGTDSFIYRVYTSRDRSTFQEVTVRITVKPK